MPTCCAANGITVVLPPKAAETVALSKVSAFMMPAADNCSIWGMPWGPPRRAGAPRPPAPPSSARQNELPARVDLALRRRKPAPDGGDGLAGDGNVGFKDVGRRRDAPTAN